MSSTTWSLVALMVALGGACGGAATPAAPVVAPVVTPAPAPAPLALAPNPQALPPIPSHPVAAPDGLVATAQVGDVVGLLATIGGFADGVQPGLGGLVTLDNLLAGAAQDGYDGRGVDVARPVRVLVLDPGRFPQPVIVVVGVGDEAALAQSAGAHGLRLQVHGGYAAIGARDALTAAGGFALTTLVATPAPAAPTVEVDVSYLMQRYGGSLDAMLQQLAQTMPPAQRPMMTATMQLYASLFGQLDRLALSLEVTGDQASVVTRMHPRPDTAFAGFLGQQAPATFTLLAQLPGATMAMGGKLELKDLWAAMGPLMEANLATTYGAAAPTMMAAWKPWTGLLTGEHAMVVGVPTGGLAVSGLWQIDDPGAVLTMWTTYMAALTQTKVPGMTFKRSAAKHRGTKLAVTTWTPDAHLAPEQRPVFDAIGGKFQVGFGVVGKQAVFALGTDATALGKALIDLAKDGPKPSAPTPAQAALAPVLADARRRGESYLIAFDLAALKARFAPAAALGNGPGPAPALPGPPVVTAIGVADGALTFRLTVPAAQVKAVAATR